MSPGPVVLKFGGTSVGDAEAIGRLVRHVSAAHAGSSAVVVVSALSGVTDRLFNLAAAAAATDEMIVLAGVAELQQRHEQVARQVVPAADALCEVLASEATDRHGRGTRSRPSESCSAAASSKRRAGRPAFPQSGSTRDRFS